ncbi:isoflavone reductase IRL [Parachaetomium inaequale]|uniref:Isoflavone reductase IRL n=1 Tax=Parachaetomium inaequale TaxID=2588326 RepID=A0AAN6P878_9PEZI|nr:isoflavone reductase IRL [Parachaetomium inaequale]
MSATKRIVVFGGNGFLGSRICRAAVARNWDVTSVSRSGRPNWLSITSSPTPPNWSHSVSWERGDIFRPTQWTSLLYGADYVVHSLGILLEADYKGVISGRESPISGLARAFSASKGAGAANPLERVREQGAPEPGLEPPSSEAQLTYEMMNRDSAILLAKEAAKEGVKAFGFVSAAAGAPVLPSRYVTTKREAEAVVAREFPEMRGVFFRPPFMYDRSRGATMGVAAVATVGSVVDGLTGGKLGGLLGSMVTKPLKADVVADAVVEALADESVKGPVEVPQLEQLAERAWRKTML